MAKTFGGPVLSVVIPTRNRPVMLKRALCSVLEQASRYIEIVLVDDASEVPQRFPDELSCEYVQVIRNQSNQGVAISRNRGIEAARGDWIAFLDDDDVWLMGFAAATLDALQSAESSLVFSWCSILNVNHAGDGTIVDSRPRVFHEAVVEEQLYRDALSIGTSWGLTVNKRCFDRVGMFDPSYRLIEDTELVMRLLAAGIRPVVVSQVLVEIHHHGDPSRLTSKSRNQERVAEIERMLSDYSAFLANYPSIQNGLKDYARSLLSEGTCR